MRPFACVLACKERKHGKTNLPLLSLSVPRCNTSAPADYSNPCSRHPGCIPRPPYVQAVVDYLRKKNADLPLRSLVTEELRDARQAFFFFGAFKCGVRRFVDAAHAQMGGLRWASFVMLFASLTLAAKLKADEDNLQLKFREILLKMNALLIGTRTPSEKFNDFASFEGYFDLLKSLDAQLIDPKTREAQTTLELGRPYTIEFTSIPSTDYEKTAPHIYQISESFLDKDPLNMLDRLILQWYNLAFGNHDNYLTDAQRKTLNTFGLPTLLNLIMGAASEFIRCTADSSNEANDSQREAVSEP